MWEMRSRNWLVVVTLAVGSTLPATVNAKTFDGREADPHVDALPTRTNPVVQKAIKVADLATEHCRTTYTEISHHLRSMPPTTSGGFPAWKEKAKKLAAEAEAVWKQTYFANKELQKARPFASTPEDQAKLKDARDRMARAFRKLRAAWKKLAEVAGIPLPNH